ncbi:MAG: winged helix-turn-helix transcriptional regulator [Dehalococcoidia bacterium]
MNRWGLLTNHALVLVHVVENPRSTLRQIADAVGITDRAAQSILRALEGDDIVARRKEGRRNIYTVDLDALLAHRQYGKYSIAEIASALLRLSGQGGAMPLAGEMGTVSDTRRTVMERLPPGDENGSS